MDPLPSINKVYSLVVQEESNNGSLSLPSVPEIPILLLMLLMLRSNLDMVKLWLVLRTILGFVPFASVQIILWSFAIKSMDTLTPTNPSLQQMLLLLEMQTTSL